MYCEDNRIHMSIHPLHRLWCLGSYTLFAKGSHYMLKGPKVSCPLIVDMISFVNIRNFFKVEFLYDIKRSTLEYVR